MSNSTVSSADVWDECIKELLEEFGHLEHIDDIHRLSYDCNDGIVNLHAPNEEIWEVIKSNHFDHIKKKLSEKCAPEKIRLLCKKNHVLPASKEASDTSTRFGQYNRLDESYVFDAFVQGDSNQYAFAGAKHVVQAPCGAGNPFVIYGDPGVGKTHLATAIAHAMLADNPQHKILLIPSEKFINDFSMSLKNNNMSEFKSFYRQATVFIVDDIQFLSGKPGTQREFFHTFNDLMARKQQVIMTCDCLPNELAAIEDRLKSRFSCGLTVGIKPPGFDTRVAILIKKAGLMQINLPQDVAEFIAKHIFSNVRELEGALKRVVAHAQFTGESITCDFAQHVLQDLLSFKARKVSIANIKVVVAQFYKIKMIELASKKRSKEIVRARQVAMYFCKRLTEHSLPEIGSHFGGRDHTTVIHSVEKIKKIAHDDENFSNELENIHRLLSV